MIEALVEAMETAERPVFYTGGGVINSGPASPAPARTGRGHGLSDHLDADGPRRLPGLGQELARHAGHARALRGQPRHAWLRPDDQRRRALRRPDHRPHRRLQPELAARRISTSTPRRSTRSSTPISRSSATWPMCWRTCCASGRRAGRKVNSAARADLVAQIEEWRRSTASLQELRKTIKPQYALERLEALTKDHDRYICTEVGQHQMWAAQFLGFEDPNRWMTSGGLGTMGYGLPASIGVQIAHPGRAGDQRRGRGLVADEHAGDGHRGAVPPAGQAVHPQQRTPRHGAPVAGASAWRALPIQLVRGPARFREAGRGLRLQGHHVQGPRRSRRRDHGDAGL
jgi:acetolactate synthase-1/2/3 large subunit